MLFMAIFQTLAVFALASEAVDAMTLDSSNVSLLRKKVQSCSRVLQVTPNHPRQGLPPLPRLPTLPRLPGLPTLPGVPIPTIPRDLVGQLAQRVERDIKNINDFMIGRMIPETQNAAPFTQGDTDFTSYWTEFSGLKTDTDKLVKDLKANINVANTGVGQLLGVANILIAFNSDWNTYVQGVYRQTPASFNTQMESMLVDTDTNFDATIKALSNGIVTGIYASLGA